MSGFTELDASAFHRVRPLFDVYDYDRVLIGGVFEQQQTGRVFCDDLDDPRCAVMLVANDYVYLVGDPTPADIQDMVEEIPSNVGMDDFEIFCPRNTAWIAALYQVFGDRLKRDGYEYFTFTNTKIEWIQSWQARVPRGMRVERMDADLAKQAEEKLGVATAETWGSVVRFVDDGFGFVVMAENGDLAGGITTYGVGEGMAEIDIATHKAYRRRGLATLMGCVFVDHCLSHNLTPSWTANYGNFGSMATARKLGFVDRFILPCFSLSK